MMIRGEREDMVEKGLRRGRGIENKFHDLYRPSSLISWGLGSDVMKEKVQSKLLS